MLHTRGLGAMGFGVPASIGACLGSGGRRTVCVDGDGSFQMNAQELETLRRLQLPVKLFVINNEGYASIRSSQQAYFQHLVAADSTSGLSLPDVKKLAAAYGLPSACIANQQDLRQQIRAVLDTPGPVVCEVLAPVEEQRAPRLSSIAATRRKHGLQATRGPVALPRSRGVSLQHDHSATGRMMHIAIMQGRLVPPTENRIQCFPRERWRDEFALAAAAGLTAIEWIYDLHGADVNPLASDDGLAQMRALSAQHDVVVWSLCADYFMDRPLLRASPQEVEERVGDIAVAVAALRIARNEPHGPAVRRCLAHRFRRRA